MRFFLAGSLSLRRHCANDRTGVGATIKNPYDCDAPTSSPIRGTDVGAHRQPVASSVVATVVRQSLVRRWRTFEGWFFPVAGNVELGLFPALVLAGLDIEDAVRQPGLQDGIDPFAVAGIVGVEAEMVSQCIAKPFGATGAFAVVPCSDQVPYSMHFRRRNDVKRVRIHRRRASGMSRTASSLLVLLGGLKIVPHGALGRAVWLVRTGSFGFRFPSPSGFARKSP
jgi:hypothetical protein